MCEYFRGTAHLGSSVCVHILQSSHQHRERRKDKKRYIGRTREEERQREREELSSSRDEVALQEAHQSSAVATSDPTAEKESIVVRLARSFFPGARSSPHCQPSQSPHGFKREFAVMKSFQKFALSCSFQHS